MKHVSPYLSMSEFDKLGAFINERISTSKESIEKSLSIKSFKEDLSFLNRVESMIPEELQFQLHLSMILEKSKESISNYNRNLSQGKNNVLEEAASSMPIEESVKLKKAFNLLVEELKSINPNELISEQSMSLDKSAVQSQYSKDFDDVMANIESPDDIPKKVSDEKFQVFKSAKSLLDSLTEGGSPIGILQFVLDIVGLVGDFFGPVGLIADSINAIIYLFRGKYVLAILSIIAAMIPFAGNVIKGIFQGTKASSKTISKVGDLYLKGAGGVGAKVTDDAAKLIANSAPETAKGLKYISETGGKALTGFSRFIDGFFNSFLGKLVGWIPLIGKPLKRFFATVSDTIAGFTGKFTKMADDTPKILDKAELLNLNKFFEATSKSGSKVSVSGADLIVTATGRKPVIIPAKFLKGTDFMVSRYGKGAGKELQRILNKAEINSLTFYKSLSKGLESMSGVYKKSGFIKIAGKVVATISFSKKVPVFIGKQIWKFVSDGSTELSDEEYEAWGVAGIDGLVQGRIDDALEKNPDAIYEVPHLNMTDIRDNDAIKALTEYQRKQAKLFGLDDIGMVGYYTRGEKDKVPEDVVNFYEDLYKGDMTQLKNMEKMFPVFENNSSKFKHIKPFSDFI